MSISEQQTAWAPDDFADANSPPDLGSVAAEAERKARRFAALAVGVLAMLALASLIQAIMAPELVAEIFERL